MSDSSNFIKMCDYFELLLRITKLDKNEYYHLNYYENDLLHDKSLYNNFMLSALTRVSMNGLEEENIVYRDKEFTKNLLSLISDNMDYKDLDDYNKLFQIRNCFCHSNAYCDDDKLYLNNHQIKGYIDTEAAFLNLTVLFSNFEYNGKYKKKYNHYLLYLPEKINNEKELNEFLNNTKEVIVQFKDSSKFNELNDIIFRLSSISTLMKSSCNRISNFIVDLLRINKSDIKIRPIDRLERSIVTDYISYIGEDEFYKLDFEKQRYLLGDILDLNKKDNILNYIALMTVFSGIICEKDINDRDISLVDLFDLDEDSNINSFNNYCTYYFRPLMYERLLMIYHTYIFNVLKEHKMNNNFLEGFIDYEELDLSRFNYKFNDNKKVNLNEEKNKLLKYYEECNRLVTKYNIDIEKLLEVRIKLDNPKNKKRDEHLEKNMNDILKIKELINKTNKEIENILFKIDYINENNEIYRDNNQFFREMRNSNTHYGFDIYRNRAYQNRDLNDLSFYYYDYLNNKKVFECYFNNNDFLDLVNQMREQVINKNKELIKV